MKKKVAIIHPQLKLGGSELVAVQVLDALKEDYDVSLICGGKADIQKLNEYYGTSIKENEITIITVKIPKFLQNKFDALRDYRLARFCKKIAPEFDVMISTYNLMDFGKKGIQFIADLSFADELRRSYDPEPNKSKKWFYKKSFLRKCYLKFAEILSGASKNGWKKNITISNSGWTKKIIKKFYNIESGVIYPPLAGKFSDIPWAEKVGDFVCLGRVSPEKEIEKIIKIVGGVRNKNPDIKLHIIGEAGDSDYAQKIKRICAQNNSWCFLEGPMYGRDKLNFIAKYKYGISGRSNEPFGLAVAEMANSGCIVFVPNGGGQTEIADDSNLIYDNVEDAVFKIKAVIGNEKLQNSLREHLLINAQKFSSEKFKEKIKEAVKKWT